MNSVLTNLSIVVLKAPHSLVRQEKEIKSLKLKKKSLKLEKKKNKTVLVTILLLGRDTMTKAALT